MDELLGTVQRPVVLVKPEFKAEENCQIEYFQLSSNGKIVSFYSIDTKKIFSIPYGIFLAMHRAWEETK